MFSKSSKKLTALQRTYEKIESKENFIKNFLGEKVKFDGKILSIEEVHGAVTGIKIRVSSESNYRLIFFGFFPLAKKNQLLEMNEGAIVVCTGNIYKNDRNGIELIDFTIQNGFGVISGIENKSDYYRRRLKSKKNGSAFYSFLILSGIICSYIFFHWILFLIVFVLFGIIGIIAVVVCSFTFRKTKRLLNCECGYKTDVYKIGSEWLTSESTTMERNETIYDGKGNVTGYTEIEAPSYHSSERCNYIAKCRECKRYLFFSEYDDFGTINLQEHQVAR